MRQFSQRFAAGLCGFSVTVVVWLGCPTPAADQFDAPGCEAATLPDESILRDTGCAKKAGDCDIAVGTTHIVLTSNCGVEIRCAGGDIRESQSDLVGSSLSTAMFKLALSGGGNAIYDPRVVWDNYHSRFWVVALEGPASDLEGRIHVAVSKDDSPYDVSTTHWNKFTQDGLGSPFDPQASGFTDKHVDDSFPDRTQIAVDETYLYVLVREAEADGNPFDDRDLMMVIPKVEMMADNSPATAVEEMKFIDVTGVNKQGTTWAHTLAVDHDIVNGGTPTVYCIGVPGYTSDDEDRDYEGILFGTFLKVGGTWAYGSTTLDLSDDGFGAFEFRGTDRVIPGGDVDDNYIQPTAYFWSACTRRVDGDRMIWATHHVCDEGASDGAKTRIQWYQIDPSVPELVEVQRISDSGSWLHDPSIAANANGDLALYYNRSADTEDDGYPEIMRRLIPADCPEDASTAVVASSSTHYDPDQTGWIDFSGTAPDPIETDYFWGHSQIVHDVDQFQTIVARYQIVCIPGPDMDGDDDIDALDLAAFLAASDRLDRIADLDQSGDIDVFDFLTFLNALSN